MNYQPKQWTFKGNPWKSLIINHTFAACLIPPNWVPINYPSKCTNTYPVHILVCKIVKKSNNSTTNNIVLPALKLTFSPLKINGWSRWRLSFWGKKRPIFRCENVSFSVTINLISRCVFNIKWCKKPNLKPENGQSLDHENGPLIHLNIMTSDISASMSSTKILTKRT